jgi:hypothetical protein
MDKGTAVILAVAGAVLVMVASCLLGLLALARMAS